MPEVVVAHCPIQQRLCIWELGDICLHKRQSHNLKEPNLHAEASGSIREQQSTEDDDLCSPMRNDLKVPVLLVEAFEMSEDARSGLGYVQTTWTILGADAHERQF